MQPQPYPQQMPSQPTPPPYYPPGPKRRVGLVIAVITVVAIVIICVMLWVFVFREGGEEKGKTMTYAELWGDVEITGMNFTTMTLKSYKDGDVLTIKDKVFFTEYYPTATPQSITLIYFQSGGYLPICLYGDKRAEYPNGTTVTISVHVKQYTIEGKSVLWLEEWYNYYATSIYAPGVAAPVASLYASISGTEAGKTQVNITWMVVSPSRPDIEWFAINNFDAATAPAKLMCEGDLVPIASYTWPTGTYVTGGDVIKTTLNRADAAAYRGHVVQLILVFAPTGTTFAQCSVALDWTT